MSKGHHVCFEKRLWLSNEPNKKLRTMAGLIIPLQPTPHSELHKEIATVPAPNYNLGMAILSAYRDNPDDPIRSVENLVRATETAIGNPRVQPIEYQLGDLMISALYAQIPFIKEGRILGK